MDYITLGRTGLKVSKVGLGCGGFSRLGQSYGASEESSINVVRSAIDIGINYIDTATSYKTEPIVGKALESTNREEVVVSSKFGIKPLLEGEAKAEEWVPQCVEASLERLQMDYIDVYHVHGVKESDVDVVHEKVIPQLLKAKEQGKIRFLAYSEAFGSDTSHEMFKAYADKDDFDVAMVGFNLINPSARRTVFLNLLEKKVGTEIMFAIRNALYQPDLFRKIIDELESEGKIDSAIFEGKDPVIYFFGNDDSDTMAEIAYRYAAYEPGADILLSGTGKVEHLKKNVNWILNGPLEESVKSRFDAVLEEIESVSGN